MTNVRHVREQACRKQLGDGGTAAAGDCGRRCGLRGGNGRSSCLKCGCNRQSGCAPLLRANGAAALATIAATCQLACIHTCQKQNNVPLSASSWQACLEGAVVRMVGVWLRQQLSV